MSSLTKDMKENYHLARLFFPHLPNLVITAIAHQLSLTSTSRDWSLLTELTIKTIRAILTSPSHRGALAQQQSTTRDQPIQGRLWIAKCTLPAPTDSTVVEGMVYTAIDALKNYSDQTYDRACLSDLTAEWTGARSNAGPAEARPRLSGEAEHYDRLMQDQEDPSACTTILYFHGGAFLVMDPATHREPVARLCRKSGARALSIRYRLAPQNPFPAALMDALLAYLSLLYPAVEALHGAVEAKDIVLAGDSAGGNLALALVQLLLQINRDWAGQERREEVRFHGHVVDFPLRMPGGLALTSAWCDMTHSMESRERNARYDYFPPPPLSKDAPRFHHGIVGFPDDDVWPVRPKPRGDFYCEAAMLCHPLVSPLSGIDWTGAPPVWLGFGEEMLVDDGQILAARMAEQGVKVRWEMWSCMCHCFAMILAREEASRLYFRRWAGFIRDRGGEGMFEARVFARKSARQKQAPGWEEREVQVDELRLMPDRVVWEKMRECTRARVEREHELRESAEARMQSATMAKL